MKLCSFDHWKEYIKAEKKSENKSAKSDISAAAFHEIFLSGYVCEKSFKPLLCLPFHPQTF